MRDRWAAAPRAPPRSIYSSGGEAEIRMLVNLVEVPSTTCRRYATHDHQGLNREKTALGFGRALNVEPLGLQCYQCRGFGHYLYYVVNHNILMLRYVTLVR